MKSSVHKAYRAACGGGTDLWDAEVFPFQRDAITMSVGGRGGAAGFNPTVGLLGGGGGAGRLVTADASARAISSTSADGCERSRKRRRSSSIWRSLAARRRSASHAVCSTASLAAASRFFRVLTASWGQKYVHRQTCAQTKAENIHFSCSSVYQLIR